MNHEFYPEALANVIRQMAQEFKGELLAMENVIATDNDVHRVDFIHRALNGIQSCIEDGIPVR